MGKKHKPIKQVEKADVEVSKAASDYREAGPVRALDWFGQLADQPPLFAFAAGVAIAGLIRRDARIVRTGARMAAAHYLGMVGKDRIKQAVDRTRPTALIDEGRYASGKGKHDSKPFNSFPSGHTAGAVAIARALAREFAGSATPAYGAAAAVATSRIAKCDHFVSDTAVGALIGAAAEAAVGLVEKSLQRGGRQGLPS